MSYLKEVVVKVLQLGIGEEFNIILEDGERSMLNPFKFTETDLVDKNGDVLNCYISILITGEYKIEKLPFVPKVGENYWTYGDDGEIPKVEFHTWHNDCYDKIRKILGVIFRTEQKAIDYLPTWEKRLEGEK